MIWTLATATAAGLREMNTPTQSHMVRAVDSQLHIHAAEHC